MLPGPPPGVLVGARDRLWPSSLTIGVGSLSQAATANTAMKNPRRPRKAIGVCADMASPRVRSLRIKVIRGGNEKVPRLTVTWLRIATLCAGGLAGIDEGRPRGKKPDGANQTSGPSRGAGDDQQWEDGEEDVRPPLK